MIEYKPKIANKYNSLVNDYIKPATDNADTKIDSCSHSSIQLKVKVDINTNSRTKTISRRNRNYNNTLSSYSIE